MLSIFFSKFILNQITVKKIIFTLIIFNVLIATVAHAQTLKFSKIPHGLSWTNKPISFKLNPEGIFIEAGEKTDYVPRPECGL